MAWLLIVIVLGVSAQDVMRKIYSRRVTGGSYSFSAATTLTAMLFFLFSSGGSLQFKTDYLPHSFWFGLAYCLAVVGSMLAVQTGPLSLTALVTSCSLILPALYGILVLGEPISLPLVLGLVLLLAALSLINLEQKGEPRKITLKWIVFVAVTFVSNGAASIIQNIQQRTFAGAYKSEFMIVALLFGGLVLLCAAAIAEKKAMLRNLWRGLPCSLTGGVSNGIVNLLVMVLVSANVPASVMFPVISAGGIILTFLISVFGYKERLSKWQLTGVALGVVATVLLNL